MTKRLLLTAVLFLLFPFKNKAQTIDSLQQRIKQIIGTKNAVVGVSITGNDGKDKLAINGEMHLPMQSVFKFPIALVVLSEIDKGKIVLDQKIEISKKDVTTEPNVIKVLCLTRNAEVKNKLKKVRSKRRKDGIRKKTIRVI